MYRVIIESIVCTTKAEELVSKEREHFRYSLMVPSLLAKSVMLYTWEEKRGPFGSNRRLRGWVTGEKKEGLKASRVYSYS